MRAPAHCSSTTEELPISNFNYRVNQGIPVYFHLPMILTVLQILRMCLKYQPNLILHPHFNELIEL